MDLNHPFDEEGVLRISIALTLLLTVLGVIFGMLAASLTLLFDAGASPHLLGPPGARRQVVADVVVHHRGPFAGIRVWQAADGTRLAWLAPHIDPVALGLVCLAVLPLPFGTVRRAQQDILLVTPSELKQHVDEVAQASVQGYGFASHRACVARVGRGQQIELHFVVSQDWPARALA